MLAGGCGSEGTGRNTTSLVSAGDESGSGGGDTGMPGGSGSTGGWTGSDESGSGSTGGPEIECPPPADGPWILQVVDEGFGFKPRTSVAVDPEGRPWVAYNVARSPDTLSAFDVRVARPNDDGSDFEIETIFPSEGLSNEYPTIATGPTGEAYVVFNRVEAVGEAELDDRIELYLAIGDRDGFDTPFNLTQTSELDEFAADIAVDADGVAHVVFLQRSPIVEDPGSFDYTVAYLSVTPEGDVSPIESLTDDAQIFSGNPEQSVAIGPDGTIHASYLKKGDPVSRGVLHHRAKSPGGSWGDETRVTAQTKEVSGASMVATNTGVHFTYATGVDPRVVAHRTLGGDEFVLTEGGAERAYYLGLAAGPDDRLHLAYRQLFDANADVFLLEGSPDGTFEPAPTPITETSDMDEGPAAITVGPCGSTFLAFPENLSTYEDDVFNGVVYLARRQKNG